MSEDGEEEGGWHWDCGLCESSSYKPGADTKRGAEQLLKRHLRERCPAFDAGVDIEAECSVYYEGEEAAA